MNERHLSRDATTVYEALEDAGYVAAAINITCYRGRHRHVPTVPGLRREVHGPSRFFFYNLYESDRTGAPFVVARPQGGHLDGYAAGVGRWLVTRDAFDFLVYYLSDYDFASHAHGPAGGDGRRARAGRRLDRRAARRGGRPGRVPRALRRDPPADHGQTEVKQVARLEPHFARSQGPGRRDGRRTARARSTSCPARRSTRRARAAPRRRACGRAHAAPRGRQGDRAARRRGFPAQRARASRRRPSASAPALANPNAGELLVSAAEGWELADLGGRHHLGGGSHGSLVAGDSFVPLLTIGVERPTRITKVVPAVLDHFGVALPRTLGRSHVSADARARMVERQLRRARHRTTSACSRRWSACRGSSSSPSALRDQRVRRRGAADRRRARRSRSRTWSRSSASSSLSMGMSAAPSDVHGSATRSCWSALRPRP